MSYHEDRADLAETISKLAPFIQQHTNLPALKCQMLAMEILNDSNTSGVVSMARAIRLLNAEDPQP